MNTGQSRPGTSPRFGVRLRCVTWVTSVLPDSLGLAGLRVAVHGVVQPVEDRLEHVAAVSLQHHQVPVAVNAVLG
jgi:hypothetical protein